MSDRTTELMRLCCEKVDLEGEDAVFFENVMNALLETRHESECQARLEEARMWQFRMINTWSDGFFVAVLVLGCCQASRKNAHGARTS